MARPISLNAKSVIVQVRVSSTVLQKLESLCESRGETVSAAIRAMIEAYIGDTVVQKPSTVVQERGTVVQPKAVTVVQKQNTVVQKHSDGVPVVQSVAIPVVQKPVPSWVPINMEDDADIRRPDPQYWVRELKRLAQTGEYDPAGAADEFSGLVRGIKLPTGFGTWQLGKRAAWLAENFPSGADGGKTVGSQAA
jgi:antitoxin component of RelBE/YafQ-DinJ toxin-antitoxin module